MFWHSWRTALRGVFLLIAAGLPAMLPRPAGAQGGELVNLKLDSTARAYDTVTNPPSGGKQDFSIPKPGFMTVIYTIEPVPHKMDSGGFRLFPIVPKNGPDWESRHHMGTVILNELTPKDARPGDKRVHKIVYRVLPTPAETMIAARLTAPLVHQAFQIGNRGEQLGAIQQLTVAFAPFEDYSKQDTTPPGLDITGVWTHGDPFGPNATWTFTPKGPGEYEAVEKGFDNAVGTAKVRGNRILIDWISTTAGDKQKKGVTIIEVDGSRKAGSGFWIGNSGEGNVRIWTTSPAKPLSPTSTATPPTTPTTPTAGTPTAPVDGAVPGSGEPATVSRFTIQVGQREGKPGELVMVPVYLLHPQGAANLNVEIRYAAEIAVPEGKIARGNVLGNTLFEANDAERGLTRLGIAGTKALSDSGILAHIPFKIVGKSGDRAVLEVAVTMANDMGGQQMNVDTLPGALLVLDASGGIPGDSDGDKTLTAGDALAALKMSVKLIPEKPAADVDQDGKVTSSDARLILQKVVGR